MRISVHAVGRLKAGPESELASRYFDRFAKPARRSAWSSPAWPRSPKAAPEAPRNAAARKPAGFAAHAAGSAALLLLDEHGDKPVLGGLRRGARRGCATAASAISSSPSAGPDGHDPAPGRRRAPDVSFGAMTWPHQLVRVMLAEQLYRAATILSGHPYHRG